MNQVSKQASELTGGSDSGWVHFRREQERCHKSTFHKRTRKEKQHSVQSSIRLICGHEQQRHTSAQQQRALRYATAISDKLGDAEKVNV
jgi:hypothetical protein